MDHVVAPNSKQCEVEHEIRKAFQRAIKIQQQQNTRAKKKRSPRKPKCGEMIMQCSSISVWQIEQCSNISRAFHLANDKFCAHQSQTFVCQNTQYMWFIVIECASKEYFSVIVQTHAFQYEEMNFQQVLLSPTFVSQKIFPMEILNLY